MMAATATLMGWEVSGNKVFVESLEIWLKSTEITSLSGELHDKTNKKSKNRVW